MTIRHASFSQVADALEGAADARERQRKIALQRAEIAEAALREIKDVCSYGSLERYVALKAWAALAKIDKLTGEDA